MGNIKIESFKVIGIKVRTSNLNGEAVRDIGALWSKFMNDDILNKIPDKLTNDIYAVYTEYDGDHLKPYTALLGCKVKDLQNVPKDMVGMSFSGGVYKEFTAKGDLTKNAVYDVWTNIWEQNLNRSYIADFEVYGEKAINPTNGEAIIYVGIL